MSAVTPKADRWTVSADSFRSRYSRASKVTATISDDPRDRREIKDAIRDESRDRARDNAMAAAVNAQAGAANQATIAARRAQSGSRFNIRYNDGFPPDALTPQGVRRALQPYVDFGRAGDDAERDTRPATSDTVSVNGGLRKGLTVIQVERILGPAAKINDRTEGSVDMNIREYNTEDEHVNCQFVGGVLISYQVTPRGR